MSNHSFLAPALMAAIAAATLAIKTLYGLHET